MVLPLVSTAHKHAVESIAQKVGQGSPLPVSMNVGWSFEK